MLLFLSYLLYFNLAFTAKKLRSDARIIAYIQVYHENCSEHWIGWETSLRNYRYWMEDHKKDLDNWLKKNAHREYVHAEDWFYIQIYRFHAIFIFFLLVMCGAIAYNTISVESVESIKPIEAFIIIPIYVGFFYYIYKNNSLHPSKSETLIEDEIAKWLDVCKLEKEPEKEQQENKLIPSKI